MPTAAYVPYDKEKPHAASNGTLTLQEIRENLMAVRDGMVLGGLPGFNCVASGGTEDQRAEYLFTNGVEQIKAAITWGTTGGATGNPETVVFTYSSDSGDTWVAIKTLTVTYTTGGYFSSYIWSV